MRVGGKDEGGKKGRHSASSGGQQNIVGRGLSTMGFCKYDARFGAERSRDLKQRWPAFVRVCLVEATSSGKGGLLVSRRPRSLPTAGDNTISRARIENNGGFEFLPFSIGGLVSWSWEKRTRFSWVRKLKRGCWKKREGREGENREKENRVQNRLEEL